MEQFDPTAPYEARRKFYQGLARDPEFQGLSLEDRHDISRKILFPAERPTIGPSLTGEEKEPSPIGRKIAAGAERLLTGVAKAAPFPGAIKALTAPETVPKAQRNLGYLLNPIPEVVSETFQRGVGTIEKTLGHEPAKLIEDIPGAILPVRGGLVTPGRLRAANRAAAMKASEILEDAARYERATDITPQPVAPEFRLREPSAAFAESPPVEPPPPPEAPVRPQPSPMEARLAEVARAGGEAESRLSRARWAPPEEVVPPVTPAEPIPEAARPVRKPPIAKGRPRKQTVEMPAVTPAQAAEVPTGPLSDPIQARLEALGISETPEPPTVRPETATEAPGTTIREPISDIQPPPEVLPAGKGQAGASGIEVPRAETQPLEVEAPAVQVGKAPETTERLTIREAAKKTGKLTDPIIGAAYRVGDRVFSGVTHMEADMAAEEAGFAVTDRQEGFVTKRGRFLNPEEAKAYVEKAPETYQGLEPEKLTAKEVVTKIEDQQAPEHFDKPKITKQVEKGGEVYIKSEVDPNVLNVPREKTVEPGISAPEKGPIVVDDKGKVIDGRHRVVDAKEAGESTIEAYVPEKAAGELQAKTEPATQVKLSAEPASFVKQPWEMGQREFSDIIFHRGEYESQTMTGTVEQTKKSVQSFYDASKAAGLPTLEFEHRLSESRVKELHRGAIEQALSEGKPVPPEVLAEYPDLQEKVIAAKPAAPTVTIDGNTYMKNADGQWRFVTGQKVTGSGFIARLEDALAAKALTSSRGAVLPDRPERKVIPYQGSQLAIETANWLADTTKVPSKITPDEIELGREYLKDIDKVLAETQIGKDSDNWSRLQKKVVERIEAAEKGQSVLPPETSIDRGDAIRTMLTQPAYPRRDTAKAEQYVSRLVNDQKRQYGKNYLDWIKGGRVGDAPLIDARLSYMAAQAVRGELNKILPERPETDAEEAIRLGLKPEDAPPDIATTKLAEPESRKPTSNDALWAGTVDARTGKVLSTYTRGQAKEAEWSHEAYLSSADQQAIDEGDAIRFEYDPIEDKAVFPDTDLGKDQGLFEGRIKEYVQAQAGAGQAGIFDPIAERLKKLGIEISPESEQITSRLPDPIEQRLKDMGIETEVANVPGPADQSTIGMAHGQRAGADIEPAQVQQPEPVGGDVGVQSGERDTVRGKAPSRGVGKGGGTGPGEPTDIDATRRPGYVGQPTETLVGGPAEGGLQQAGGKGPGAGAEAPEIRPINHSLPQDHDWIPTGDKPKARANLEAIRVLKALEDEGRLATPEEKEILAKYVGWGGLKQAFDSGKAAYRTRPGWTDEQKREAANWEKNWGQLYDQVKASLTPEEYHRAAQSLENAHYTSREVVNAVWDTVRQFGFRGGKALEPAVGSGNFIGLTPEGLKGKVKWRAVELDDVSARIAAQLYPEAQVEQADFKDAKIPINSQDLVITNVPFSSEIIRDAPYPDFSLHNFYLAKSLDAVKPGGIVAAITSLSTLEAPISHAARKYLAERAQLIGAIRLPNNTFWENARTEVSTDLLFFRKHDGQAVEGQPFVHLKPSKTYDDRTIQLNEYFVDHPEMMLGKMSLEGTMRGAGEEKALLPNNEPLPPQLKEAIAKLPADVMGSAAPTAVEEARVEKIGGKVGNYIIRNDAVLKVGAGNEAIIPNWAADRLKVAQAKRYIGMRDQASELNELQRNPDAGDSEVEAARAELNRRYDEYVARHGHLGEKGTNFLKDDREFARVAALEEIKYEIVEQRAKTGKPVFKKQGIFSKRSIFSRRTIFPIREPAEIDNVPDALDVSFNFRGRPDIDYIANLTKKNPEAVAVELEASGLAFQDPKTGTWQDRVEYLSGQVKDKLAKARQLAEAEPRYLKHVEELEKVQPRYLNIAEFSTRLGASWIPPEIIERFIRETFDRRATVGVTPETATWHVSYPKWEHASEADMTVWGIHGISGTSMVEHSLNLKRVNVYDSEPDGHGGTRNVLNKGKTLEARSKQGQVKREFQRWARSVPEVAAELEPIYNQELNISTLPQHRAPSWTHYPGASNDIALRPDQKVAVSRGLKNSLGIFHAPGNGKTYIAATIAMEARRLGLATKPMIPVQNSTLEQFPKMFLKLYPNAKILAPSKDDFSPERRNRTVAQIATEDWDAVIIPHSFFDMIPDDFDRQQQFITDRIQELKATSVETRRAQGRRSGRETDLQRAIRKLEKRLEKLLDSRKDDVFTFEQLGIDMLLIDEFHRYKKLEFDSHMDNIKGLDKDFSQRGLSAYLKIRYVQEKAQGRNAITLTGTPLTNTSAEAWNMIRYIRPDILQRYGIEQFDAFAGSFGQTKTELELTAGGTFKEVTRFEGYNNAQQFIQAWLEAADVVTAEMVNLPGLPQIKGGKVRTIELEQTPELTAEIRFIRSELERFDKMTGKEKKENTHIPITMYTRGAKAALDMRLVNPFLPDNPGNKVNATAREALRIYQESRPVKGAMFIFADLHQDRSKNPRFDLYQELKRKLIAGGIPAKEVVIMDASVDGAKRAAVLEAFGRGEIAVLIGHSERLGVGVDQPDHAVASIDMDAPHNPMYLEQRHARSVRQGNLNPEVELISLGVKNSLDAMRYQRLTAKQKQFNQLLRGNVQGQFIEDPLDELQLSFQDQMAAYSGNPKVIEKVRLENAIREMEALQVGHIQQVAKARGTMAGLETKTIPKKKESLVKAQADSAELATIFGDGKEFEPVLELGGKVYRGKKDVAVVLDTWAKRVIDAIVKQIEEEKIKTNVETKNAVVFSLNGKLIEAHVWSPSYSREETLINWRFAGSSEGGNMRTGSGFLGHSLPTALEKLRLHVPKQIQDEIAIDERSLRELQTFIQQPFERTGELKLAQHRLGELIAELRAEGVATSQTPETETAEVEFPVSMDTIEGLPTEEAAKLDAQVAGLRRSMESAERAGDTDRAEVLRERIREIQAK